MMVMFLILWAFCGVAAWRIIIKMKGGVESGYDAFMIGPCMVLGPIVLAHVAFGLDLSP